MPDDHADGTPVDSSMAGRAYAAIKKRILDSRYIPGERDKEIADLLDLRLLLETQVAERAARSIGDHDLRRLRRAFVAFSPSSAGELTERAFDEFNEFDSLLHLTLYRAAGNALITEILANILDRVQWLKTSTRPSVPRIRSGYAELRRILEALEAREPKLAATRMREHITNAAAFVAQNRAKSRANGDGLGQSAKVARPGRRRT